MSRRGLGLSGSVGLRGSLSNRSSGSLGVGLGVGPSVGLSGSLTTGLSVVQE